MLRKPTQGRRRFVKDMIRLIVALPVIGGLVYWLNKDESTPDLQGDVKDKNGQPIKASDIDIGSGKICMVNEEKILVINDLERYYALYARCTHQGCIVRWNTKEALVQCGCHGARFDTSGHVLMEPATRPLTAYQVVIKDGFLKLSGKKIIPA